MGDEKKRMVCLKDYEEYAATQLSSSTYDYFRGGADEEITAQDNVHAYSRYRIYPRVLVDISSRDLSTSILGHKISFPVGIAPTAMHCLAHPDGELATARGAQEMGIPYVQSLMSTRSLEEISVAAPGCFRFFQMYVYRDRDITRRLVERAEECGYSGFVIPVDVPMMGKRRADIRNNFRLPSHLRYGNFENSPQTTILNGMNGHKSTEGLQDRVYDSKSYNDGMTFDDIEWIRSITKLPIILKGILRASDAVKAAERGVSAIIVSNHGGRQLDSTPATLDVVGEVVDSVRDRCEVYVDGGIRTGTDVLKALALGAQAVFIGRPVVYSLTYQGQKGLVEMLNMLKDEFSRAMAFTALAPRRLQEGTALCQPLGYIGIKKEFQYFFQFEKKYRHWLQKYIRNYRRSS